MGKSPSPTTDLSNRLGGFTLGTPRDEFKATCEDGGGELLAASEFSLGCSVAPRKLRSIGANPVPLPGSIVGTFCGPRGLLCEIGYVFDGRLTERNEQISALLSMLEGKYGPPNMIEGYEGRDVVSACESASDVHSERHWLFDWKQRPPHPYGWARLVFDCDGHGAEPTNKLTLFYAGDDGYRERIYEIYKQQDNR